MYKIYGLVNPFNNRVIYIGQTRQSLADRLAQTRFEWRNSKGGRRKHHAITHIYNRGGEISIVELDRAKTQLECDFLEKKHIAYLLSKGYKLANTSKGGAGNWGVRRGKAEREKIARSVAAYHQSKRSTE